MSKLIKVKVRENNNYRVSKTESYGPGEVFEVDELELAAVPHCLVSLEAEEAFQAAQALQAKAQAEASSSFFNAAREGAVASMETLRQSKAVSQALKGEMQQAARARLSQDSEPAEPIAKAPKSNKKPDLA